MPGPGGSLRFTTQPEANSAGFPLSVQPVVTVRDTCGQTKTSYNGPVSVSLAPDAGAKGAVLSGETTVNALDGVATFSGLSVDRPGIRYVLLVSAEGYMADKSASFDVHPSRFYVRPAAQGGSDANDGLSWETAKATVQAALDAAIPPAEVWVAQGTYGRIALKSGVTLYGGFSGTEESRQERDPSAHETVLDGGSRGSVVSVGEDVVQEATVDGFTIQHGSGRAGSGGSVGGGIDCYHGNVRIVGCVVRENVAGMGLGGGLFAEDGRVTLIGNTFTGNRVSAGPSPTYGGNLGSALFAIGDPVLIITGNTFSNNTADNVTSGESIFVTGGDVTLTANRIQDNSGGVDIGTADLVCTDNLFQGNGYGIRASGGSHTALIARNRVVGNRGFGISCDHISATVQYNTVTDEGGSGIYANAHGASGTSGIITIENNLVARNRASDGGGIYATSYGSGMMRVRNNTIVGNSAERTGGGLVVNPNNKGPHEIANNVIAFNQAGTLGGGASIVGSSYLGPYTVSHNDVYGNTPTQYDDLPDPTGTNGNISEDPLFADRANGDYHLLYDSPGIDTGDNSVITSGGTDLDGKPRIFGVRVDMGAYEFLPGRSFSWAEVLKALKAAGGLVGAATNDVARLNVVGAVPARVDLLDAARLARKAAGLDANP